MDLCKLSICVVLVILIIIIASTSVYVDKIRQVHKDEYTDVDIDDAAVAIATLTRGGFADHIGYDSLIKRNISIETYVYGFQNQNKDVLIFHEGNVSLADQDYIQSKTPSMPLIFVNVASEFGDVPKAAAKPMSNYCHVTELSDSFPVGYKHMCRFWFSGFLRFTTAYRYVIRIDDDCIVNSFPEGLVQLMDVNDLTLVAAKMDSTDSTDVTIGLQDFVRQNFFQEIDFFKFPYTNVVIFDADYFRSSIPYQNFVDLVDASGCIYVNRWGDLPLWGAAIQVLHINSFEDKRIAYLHGSHNAQIN